MFIRVCVHDRISGSKKAGKWHYAAHRAEVHSANSQEVFTMSSKSGVKVVSQSPQSKVPQSFAAVGLVFLNFMHLPRAFQILFGGFCPGGG